MRLDRIPHDQRILAALRAGDMTTTELRERLRVSHVGPVLHRLEAQGLVVCVAPASGMNNAAVWALLRRRESAA